ncbi:hypothetical protein NQ315_005567 [Exocentrus adspersus]|uniref:Uncharacterized protein n=1 Tax=Exocentrus adspersus TaxID=1586481 RepID=A0AAV8VT72_9CUCU|nr:hypothetical protein NQ315_005567 [Exocentrus adspersus]
MDKIVAPLRVAFRNSQSTRSISIIPPNRNVKAQEQVKPAINEAEKIVGYPTSFLSLRWILNDEVANIALHLRKLIGTNHPLLNTARDLIVNKQSLNWGLIVLLVSKAGGIKSEFSYVDCDITAGILHSQRVLAEVTEMIRTSNLLHKSVQNVKANDPNFNDFTFGNKLSMLTGDYLLSTSFRELAGLKNHDLNEFISSSLRDLAEAQFIEPRDKQNRPLPAPPLTEQKDIKIPNQFDQDVLQIGEVLGNAKAEWTLRHLLDGGSLLAKCCQGALMLAEQPQTLQKLGYLLGRNIALAWQACKDQKIFDNGRNDKFSLVCAPLLFHIQSDPSYYARIKEYADTSDVNYTEIREVVKSGPGLQKTIELQEEFSLNALNVLEEFPDSEAKSALINIIKSM